MNYWDDEDIVKKFFSKVDKTDNCWNWKAGCFTSGYGQFYINRSSKGAHRVSFELFHKRTIAEGMYILHSCDNPKCCNPTHLSEGTPKENSTDMCNKSRSAKGSLQGCSKLTEKQVLEIRTKYSLGTCSRKQLQKEYDVSKTLIGYIINRKIWKHI
jgi:hypothetical protein